MWSASSSFKFTTGARAGNSAAAATATRDFPTTTASIPALHVRLLSMGKMKMPQVFVSVLILLLGCCNLPCQGVSMDEKPAWKGLVPTTPGVVAESSMRRALQGDDRTVEAGKPYYDRYPISHSSLPSSSASDSGPPLLRQALRMQPRKLDFDPTIQEGNDMQAFQFHTIPGAGAVSAAAAYPSKNLRFRRPVMMLRSSTPTTPSSGYSGGGRRGGGDSPEKNETLVDDHLKERKPPETLAGDLKILKGTSPISHRHHHLPAEEDADVEEKGEEQSLQQERQQDSSQDDMMIESEDNTRSRESLSSPRHLNISRVPGNTNVNSIHFTSITSDDNSTQSITSVPSARNSSNNDSHSRSVGSSSSSSNIGREKYRANSHLAASPSSSSSSSSGGDSSSSGRNSSHTGKREEESSLFSSPLVVLEEQGQGHSSDIDYDKNKEVEQRDDGYNLPKAMDEGGNFIRETWTSTATTTTTTTTPLPFLHNLINSLVLFSLTPTIDTPAPPQPLATPAYNQLEQTKGPSADEDNKIPLFQSLLQSILSPSLDNNSREKIIASNSINHTHPGDRTRPHLLPASSADAVWDSDEDQETEDEENEKEEEERFQESKAEPSATYYQKPQQGVALEQNPLQDKQKIPLIPTTPPSSPSSSSSSSSPSRNQGSSSSSKETTTLAQQTPLQQEHNSDDTAVSDPNNYAEDENDDIDGDDVDDDDDKTEATLRASILGPGPSVAVTAAGIGIAVYVYWRTWRYVIPGGFAFTSTLPPLTSPPALTPISTSGIRRRAYDDSISWLPVYNNEALSSPVLPRPFPLVVANDQALYQDPGSYVPNGEPYHSNNNNQLPKTNFPSKTSSYFPFSWWY